MVILILHRWLRVESIREWTVDTSIAAQSSACTEACKFQERRRLELLPAILGHPRARKLLVSRSTGTNASNYERSKILRSCSDSFMQPPLSRAFPLHLREIHWKQLRRFHGRAYPLMGQTPEWTTHRADAYSLPRIRLRADCVGGRFDPGTYQLRASQASSEGYSPGIYWFQP